MSGKAYGAAVALAVCWLPLLAGGDEVLEWRDAGRCVGRVCSLRGTVAMVEDYGPTFRLYFDASDRSVRVILMRGWLVTWPRYEGQTIVATGKVGRFRDHVEMIVTDPRAIEMVGGTPTATPEMPLPSATSSVPPATPTASVAAPTSAPTSEPTSAPTAPPTDAPTPAPSPEPTAVPTAMATLVPTLVPTPAPTPPPGEVEQLRERVRELDERLRRLESQP